MCGLCGVAGEGEWGNPTADLGEDREYAADRLTGGGGGGEFLMRGGDRIDLGTCQGLGYDWL